VAAWIGPAIVAAIISAFVTGLSWWVSDRQAARRLTQQRQERVADLQTALLAEIRASRYRLEMANLQDHATRMKQTMLNEPGFTPFVPLPVQPFVLNAILSEIHVLPIGVIDPVVIYYRQTMAVSQLSDDLRSDRFGDLDPARKAAIYDDYVALLIHADVLAEQAVSALYRSLNIPVVALSAPGSGEARDEAADLNS